MDVATILDLISKGIVVAEALLAAGLDAAKTLATLKQVVDGAKAGTLTTADIAAHRADFDAALAEFNTPMPPDDAA